MAWNLQYKLQYKSQMKTYSNPKDISQFWGTLTLFIDMSDARLLYKHYIKIIFFKSSIFSKRNLQKICKVYFCLQSPSQIWIFVKIKAHKFCCTIQETMFSVFQSAFLFLLMINHQKKNLIFNLWKYSELSRANFYQTAYTVYNLI